MTNNPIIACLVALAFSVAAMTARAGTGAFPTVAPAPSGAVADTAYSFTSTTTDGSGTPTWSFKLPGPGTYLATFAMNFVPAESASPILFSCFLYGYKNQPIAESSATTSANSLLTVGLSGSGVIDVTKGKLTLKITCGAEDGSPWTIANRPLEVTFVKLAGHVTGAMSDPHP